MTVKNGAIVKDDGNSRSQYKTNIVLGSKIEDSKRDRKSFEPNKSKRKSKHDEADASDEEDGSQYQEDVKQVSYFQLFRYATKKDRALYVIGLLSAVATGLTTPANSLIFGNLANDMIDLGGLAIGGKTYRADDDYGTMLLDKVRQFSLQNTYIGIVMLVCSYLSITCFNYAAHSQILTIRSKFFRSILHQDMKWYDFNQSGEVASRMNEDLSKMEDGLAEKVVMFVHYLVAFVGSLVLAFVKGWQLSLVCLTSLPLTFIAMGLVAVATSRLAKKEVTVYAGAAVVAEGALSGIRTVKAFEGEAKEVAAYKERVVSAKLLNIKRNMFSGIGFGLLWFFIYASYALAFWYGVGLVIKGYNDVAYENYDPGTMITVFFSVMMGSMNIGMAAPYIEAFGIAKGACAKVFHIIEQIPEINPIDAGGKKLTEPITTIEFKDVEFQYPTRPEIPILNRLNLKIHRGQTVALVGPSGCGKSTCIQLAQRFYDPQAGDLYFNGSRLRDIDINWLRSRIGVVGQEPVLFGTSIYENIRYGREDATRAEIEAAAAAANAAIFIKKLPRGYDTLVGERGAQLSGGQKQRIAIARALIRDPEILLLDEATPLWTPASEAKVQAALEKVSAGRTTIIVAHRLSTVRRADRIVVINKGEVVESGTHQELMQLKDHYYNLVTTQLGDDDGSVLSPSGDIYKNFDIKDEDEEEIKVLHEEDEEEVVVSSKKDKMKKKKKVKDPNEVKPMTEVMKMSKPEYLQITVGCISSVIMGCAMPIFAVLFGSILQVLSVKNDDQYVRENSNQYSLYFLIAGVVVGIATFFQIYFFGIAGERLTERLRGLMFESMLRQEVAWFDDKANGTGSLCARLSGDAAAVQGATGQRIGTIIQSVSTLALGVGLSMYYEWSLGLVALAFTPFILIAFYMQRTLMAEENMGSAKTMENCTKLAVEVVSNIRTVVSLGREEMFHQNYIGMLTPAVVICKRNTHFRGLVYGLARSLMFFAYAACIYYGTWCVINRGMKFGDVFKVSQALIMGTASIANALAFAPNMQKGISAAKTIFTFLRRQPLIVDRPGVSRDPWHCDGSVRYDKVEFSYPTRREIQVLKGLHLGVGKGQKVALVGPSGCGKSTCIQLIQRFYDVDNGAALIDERDVRDVTMSNLRNQLGIVSQEPILFDRTIRENIAYGDNSRSVTDQEIISACKKSNIHEFIANLPLGYDTRMGEKGAQLSGGQKQRIAIARALIRNPKIMLLDEATSALDAESEKVVQDALDAASEGRTTISIAHRLSTVVHSDVIFVFENGVVCETGDHKQLLANRGLYYTLYKLQSGAM
ncbi:LOW QUALITY PROTEIN: ATP-dependent translocase ABCB1 [Drosophila gunungcola]|uniref:LOW QUALITY PROTEIN: ATP-dependent translocase ABCB1 n=1 Tax=Drosophila gunungcola TaxID=103775 RepID=UPI0022E353A3|nr:LOW QUALITY PROTEIN: ATP-dependent translocase ABCB1 [Drosophila gunungcola]